MSDASASLKPSRSELEARLRILEDLLTLKTERMRRQELLRYDWLRTARPEQLEPAQYKWWLVLAGRGYGKTRVLSETVRRWATSGRYRRIALVARTSADVRDVIVEGESGILSVCSPDERPRWNPSNRKLMFPNGAVATTYSAEEPDQLRGPQHDAAACDELASWNYGEETWANLHMGLRVGKDPRIVIATTPRPTKLILDIMSAPETHLTRGKTRDNYENLAPGVVEGLESRYGGTRLGRQELDGEVLQDSSGALWRGVWIEGNRVYSAPQFRRLVVAIDPAVSSHEGSDETGIILAGVGFDGRAYVLADSSGRYRPEEWARAALKLYETYRADEIVAEANNGGEMVASTLRVHNHGANVRTVHATRGKMVRAEPIAALYEKGLVSHVGAFPKLEEQLTTWDSHRGRGSPDRLDALVWALTALMTPPSVSSEHSYDF